jgi:hypothetical protein
MLLPIVSLVFLFGAFVSLGSAQSAMPAPKRDLTGIWAPAVRGTGTQPNGASNMPDDGKPEHDLHYTPYGLQVLSTHKAPNGTREVAPTDENDPAHACDPMGFPRQNLFELRATQFMQTPIQMIMLYTYNKVWRNVWIDGRGLPKDPDPHWYGYSVGKWTDDFTFEIDTNGTDYRTWVDNAGRPHSDELTAHEIWHRIDLNSVELSMTIADPRIYERPWLAINKMRFSLQPPTYETPEMICSPSEIAEYNKRYSKTGGTGKK